MSGGRHSSDESTSDRSTPKGRPRTRTYHDHTDSYSTDYSDDFESDNRRSVTPPRRKDGVFRRSTGRPYASCQSSAVTLRSSGTSKKSLPSTKRRGTYRATQHSSTLKNTRRSNTSNTKRSPRPPIHDAVTRHMLAAKQSEMNDIKNRLHSVKQKLEAAESENKVLKTLQRRQDKAIRRYESAENDLPRLVSQNFEDQRVLKARLRRTQEAEKTLESKLRANNDEMQKMENTLRRLKKLVYDKSLGERSELATQLTDAENGLHLANRKISELDKKLDLAVNSYTRQLNSERLKHKDTKDKMEMLHEEYKTIDAKLKEKERALDVGNIYSLRKSPGKGLLSIEAPKYPSTPLLLTSETQTDLRLTLLPHNAPDQPLTNGIGSHSPLEFEHGAAGDSPRRDKKRNEGGKSVFLTANFDSPLSSRNNSFVTDSSGFAELTNNETPLKLNGVRPPSQNTTQRLEKEKKEEEEREKLAAAQREKAKLLLKMREIEDGSVQPLLSDDALKSGTKNEPASLGSRNPKYVRSVLGTEGDTSGLYEDLPAAKPQAKPQREISFGSYAPTVGSVPRRKGKEIRNSPKRASPESGSDDVPLFDLNSGKQNKKSDLLTQLFGHQDKPNPILATGSSTE